MGRELPTDEPVDTGTGNIFQPPDTATEDTPASTETTDASVSSEETVEVDASTEEPGNEADSSPAATDTGDTSDADPLGVRKRIDKLTKQREDANRRSELAEQREAAALRQLESLQQAPAPEPQVQAPEPVKGLKDFNYDENAFAQYLNGRATEAAREAAREEGSRFREEQNAISRRDEFKAREEAFEKTNPDYKAIAHHAKISDPVAGMIIGMEDGAEIAYHLGNNEETAVRISGLPDTQAAIELGKIAARLEDKRNAPKPVSDAPPPTPKLEATSPGVRTGYHKGMTDKQFKTMREKEIASR